MASTFQRVLSLLVPLLLAGCTFDAGGLPASSTDGPLDLISTVDRIGWADRSGADAPMQVVDADGAPRDSNPSDGNPQDGPPLDSVSLADKTPAPDKAPPPDQAPLPDKAPPPDQAPPPPSCDSLYKSKTPGYFLCKQTTTTCKFYFSGSSVSCAKICGAACLKTEDNDPGSKCDPEQPMLCGSGPCTCSSTLGDGQCTCKR